MSMYMSMFAHVWSYIYGHRCMSDVHVLVEHV